MKKYIKHKKAIEYIKQKKIIKTNIIALAYPNILTIKNSENINYVYIYYENESGECLNILNNKMGDTSEILIENFILGMNNIVFDIAMNNRVLENIILLMIYFLDINYGDVIIGGKSYCSHSRGFLTFFNNSNQIENEFEKCFQENKFVLSNIYDFYKINGKESKIYYLLNQNLNNIKEKAYLGIKNGNIKFVNYKPLGNLYNSKFHSLLYSNKKNIVMLNSKEFLVKRFGTICFYEFLRFCLSINYKDRSLLSYLIYRTIEYKEGLSYVN